MANEPRVGLRVTLLGLLHNSWPALVGLAVLLGVWEAAHRYGPWPAYLFPGPMDVLAAIVRLFQEASLWPSLLVTLRRLFFGFGISLIIGGFLAFIMARYARLRLGTKPYLLGLQSLPSLAWVPLAILWFGYSEDALVFVTVIGSVFAVTIAFTDALGSVRPAYLYAARNMGSHGMGLILRVMIPAALPGIVAGAKQCWSFAWRSLVGAEIIFASIGLGFLLTQGREFLDVPQVFAVMLATLFVGLLFEVFAFSKIDMWIKRRWGLVA